jgi:hypothetical protein
MSSYFSAGIFVMCGLSCAAILVAGYNAFTSHLSSSSKNMFIYSLLNKSVQKRSFSLKKDTLKNGLKAQYGVVCMEYQKMSENDGKYLFILCNTLVQHAK